MPDLVLIATGSELHLAVVAQEELSRCNFQVRVVSMPCWELFDLQPREYRDSVLPPQVTKRLTIEASSPLGWHCYVGTDGNILGIEQFGASASGEIVLREYGFTVENVCRRSRRFCNETTNGRSTQERRVQSIRLRRPDI